MTPKRAKAELYEHDHRVVTQRELELEEAVRDLLRRTRTDKGLPPTIQRPDYYRRIAGVLARAEARGIPPRASTDADGPAHRQAGGDQ